MSPLNSCSFVAGFVYPIHIPSFGDIRACKEKYDVGVNILRINHPICISLFITVLLASSLAIATPIVTSVSPSSVPSGGLIKLAGSGFGAALEKSEVVAGYEGGFFYALEHTAWSNSSISVSVPDMGKRLKVKLYVVAGGQSSKPVSVTIKPEITGVLHGEIKKHQLSVGDKGEDLFKITNRPATCRNSGELFDHAKISVVRKRFAEAQFVALPAKGCSRCSKIKVRWYNEPTGRLQYRLKIFKRQIEGICQQRVRRLKAS